MTEKSKEEEFDENDSQENTKSKIKQKYQMVMN